MIKRVLSIIIFIWSILFFNIGLFGGYLPLYNNVSFWLPIIFIIGVLVYQIVNYDKKFFCVILTEIIIFSVSLHLIYQVGYYGLRGSDSYYDYNLFKMILSSGSFVLNGEISCWPILHVISTELSLLTNIDSLTLAKYFSSVFSSLLVLPLAALVKKVYSEDKIALLVCLIFVTVPNFVNFEGLFVREIMGLFFLLLTFFIIYSYSKDNRYIVLFLILLPVIILSHHFSSFLFTILVLMYILVTRIPYITQKSFKFNYFTKNNLKWNGFSLNNIYFLMIVSLFSYWLYIATSIWRNLTNFVRDVTGVNEIIAYSQQAGISSNIASVRGLIIFYGFFFFILSFLILQIIEIICNKKNEVLAETTFLFFFIFCGLYGFVSLYISGALISPDRMLTFAWLFGIIPVAALYFKLSDLNRYKKPLLLLLIGFMIFNIYNINPSYINQDYSALGLTGTINYAIAENFEFPISYHDVNNYKLYFAYSGAIGAIYDIQGLQPRNTGVDATNIMDFTNKYYIVIINENIYLSELPSLQKKSLKEYNKYLKLLNYKNQTYINKIADYGSGIYILKGGGPDN